MAVSRTDALLLGLAVAAISTSAPLTQEAAAPALAVAFWRNAFAAGGLVPVAAAGRGQQTRPGGGPVTAVGDQRRAWVLAAGAGVVLAAHFATWISSLSLTSVAASVALVSTQPVWTALLARVTGETLDRRAWIGIGIALVGVVIARGTGLGGSGRALRGDLLALGGGVLAAAYVSIGALSRRHLSTTDYTATCYSVAAIALLPTVLVAGQHLTGFDGRTWLCLAAITIGPQLLGHSVFNRLLRTVGPTIVSVAILGEIIGAPLLAAWWLGESPPLAIIPGAVCIAAGVVLVIRGREPGMVGPIEIVAG